MRKVILLLVTMMCLTACGNTTPNEEINSTMEKHYTEEFEVETPSTKEAETTENKYETWGIKDDFVATHDDKMVGFHFCFPKDSGIPEGTGLVSRDGNIRIILDAYLEGISPEVNDISEVFPAYTDQTIAIFEINIGSRYSNGKLEFESQEIINVNGYEICKYIGTHTFTYERKTERECKCIAYVTQLKNNGAYVYWILTDESDDQSLFETMEDHAYNMATTLWES